MAYLALIACNSHWYRTIDSVMVATVCVTYFNVYIIMEVAINMVNECTLCCGWTID